MFTGDRSGDWLYRALFRAGLATSPVSTDRNDGTELVDCLITAAAHCAPPGNRPEPEELARCQPHLDAVIRIGRPRVIVALGQIAWKAVIRLVGTPTEGHQRGPRARFAHGAGQSLADGRWLIASYHPSQQNTFTGRLTEAMLDDVFRVARERAGLPPVRRSGG